MDPVILVVADPGDRGARAVAAQVGSGASYVVGTRDLLASTWHHEVTRAGKASTRLALPGHPVLADADIGAVLFRGDIVAWSSGPAGDQAYAGAEWTALLVSWLAGLGDRVVNPVEGGSAVGPAWSQRRWLLAADRAGLTVDRGGGTGRVRRTVLVAGEVVVGQDADIVDRADSVALIRLADRAGCRLLEASIDGDGLVVGVTPVPALEDPSHVHETARMLARLAGAGRGVAA